MQRSRTALRNHKFLTYCFLRRRAHPPLELDVSQVPEVFLPDSAKRS